MQKIKDHSGLIFISLVTILYLWIVCNLVINLEELKALKLNEKGDFLAGIFSPLAFLWLIFGYYQQGLELQQNTIALKRQATELANSVREQKRLVALQEKEQEEKHFQVLPKFTLLDKNVKTYIEPSYIDDGEGTVIETIYEKNLEISFTLVNHGELAKNVLVKNIENEPYVRIAKHKINYEEQLKVSIEFNEQFIEQLEEGMTVDNTLLLIYTNVYGLRYTKYIKYGIYAYFDPEECQTYFPISVEIQDKV